MTVVVPQLPANSLPPNTPQQPQQAQELKKAGTPAVTAGEAGARACGADYRFACQTALLAQFRCRLELVPEFRAALRLRQSAATDYCQRLWDTALRNRFLYDAFLGVSEAADAAVLADVGKRPLLLATDVSLRSSLTLANCLDLLATLDQCAPAQCRTTGQRTRLFLCLHTFQYYQHRLGAAATPPSPLQRHLAGQRGMRMPDGRTVRLALEPQTRGVFVLETGAVEYNPFLLAIADIEGSYLTKAIDDIKAQAFAAGAPARPPLPFAVPALWPQSAPPISQGGAPHFGGLPCRAGLRGLRNLGNSCYMNVILQAFTHNSALKAFFLGDYHDHRQCVLPACMLCQVDRLLVSLHSGETVPYAPTSFLLNLWRGNPHLATAAQHDAHEFYMSVLALMHENASELNFAAAAAAESGAESSLSGAPPSGRTRAPSRGGQGCRCVSHAVFYGTEVSHIICTNCRNETRREEDFGNISLSLREASPAGFAGAPDALGGEPGESVIGSDGPADESEPKRRRKPEGTGKVGRPRKHALPPRAPAGLPGNSAEGASVGATSAAPYAAPALSIVECLQRYTAPERLTYHCSQCQNTRATKQFSFKRLPPVLTIQLKRFEHTTKTARKINTFVRFPTVLNMSPYTTHAVSHRRYASSGTDDAKTADSPATPITPHILSPSITHADPSDPGYTYNLFCVIHHLGELESGHYIAFVRHARQWFQIDDDMVALVSAEAALGTTAYMLFYSRDFPTVPLPLADAGLGSLAPLVDHSRPAAAPAASPAKAASTRPAGSNPRPRRGRRPAARPTAALNPAAAPARARLEADLPVESGDDDLDYKSDEDL